MKRPAWPGYSLSLVCSYSTAPIAQPPGSFGRLTSADADRLRKQIIAADAVHGGDDQLACEQIRAELPSLATDLGPAADRAGAPVECIMQKEEELSAKAEAGYAAEMAAANAGAATALIAPNAVAMNAGEARQARRTAEAMANARAMEPDVAEIAARHLDDGDARDGPYRSVDQTVETDELPSDRVR